MEKELFIETLSGRKFYLLYPDRNDYYIPDMIHGVSREIRFGNQISDIYTVAQHLLMCGKYANHCGYSPFIEFMAASHDLMEGLLGDITKPLKQLNPDFEMIEDMHLNNMWSKAFGLREITKEEFDIIHDIDYTLLRAEAVVLDANKTGWVDMSGILGGYVDNVNLDMESVRIRLAYYLKEVYDRISDQDAPGKRRDTHRLFFGG